MFSIKKFDEFLIILVLFLSAVGSSFVAASVAYSVLASTKSILFYIFFVLFFLLAFQSSIIIISFVFGKFNYFYKLQIDFFECIISSFKKEKDANIYKEEKIIKLKKIIDVKNKKQN